MPAKQSLLRNSVMDPPATLRAAGGSLFPYDLLHLLHVVLKNKRVCIEAGMGVGHVSQELVNPPALTLT